MAGNNNSKFLFRNPALDPEFNQVEHLPRDIAEWFDKYATSGRGPAAGGGSSGAGGFNGDGGSGTNSFPTAEYNHDNSNYRTTAGEAPGTTALQPQILALVRQQVVQDPQGVSTITATFSIGPEQDNMEYELRLTKK